jgi:biopolymer transport protein ExbD
MHGIAAEEDEPIAELNLIPLIDVALTLLIILMVTTAFVRPSGLKVNLPKAATREGAPETPKDFTISVAADGSPWIDGKPTDLTALRSKLGEAAARDPNTRILIKGDRSAAYQHIVRVMDLVRQSGLTRVALPTETDREPPTTGTEELRRALEPR